MPRIAYERCVLKADGLAVAQQANEICVDYARQGYDLTLRQLYYQFVSRDLLPNKQTSYDRLGRIVSDARLCGIIDWNHVSDRTRNPVIWATSDPPQEELNSLAEAYFLHRWRDGAYRVEIWVEKEALAGVVQRPASGLMVDYFACKGYVSQSEMWRAGRRLASYATNNGQIPVVLHLGDHDPSGIDMSRDIQDRLRVFMDGTDLEFKRIALTMEQIRELNPPPNPAKVTDSRFEEYLREYGPDSWELDALDPAALTALIQREVEPYRDRDAERVILAEQEEIRDRLRNVAENWEEIA